MTGSSSLSCSSVAMDSGTSRTRPRLVPTHRHGVGSASDLRPYDSANCSVVTASLVSRSTLETLELRDRLKEFSRLSEKKDQGVKERGRKEDRRGRTKWERTQKERVRREMEKISKREKEGVRESEKDRESTL